MKTTFKSSISTLIISTILATCFVPRTSHATVGGALSIFGGAGIPVMVVGGATVGGGLVLVGVGELMGIGHPPRDFNGLGFELMGMATVMVGLVILDEKDQQGVSFGTLDGKTAEILNITPSELDAYNSELDEVNAIRDEVTARLLESKNPTVQLSQKSWNELKGSISLEAFSVVEKISLKMVDTFKAEAAAK